MSYRALLDVDAEITAEDAFQKYGKKRKYLCPNPDCHGEMILKSYKGESNHFFAGLKNAHKKDCFIAKYAFKKCDYNEKSFCLSDIYQHIIKKNINTINNNTNNESRNTIVLKNITTVHQLYSLCISSSIDDFYNETKIRKIILDNRTSSFYKDGLFGIHLVECTYCRYDTIKLRIYFKTCNDFRLYLHFNDIKQYRIIRNNMYTSKPCIIILGDWSKDDKYYYTEFFSKRQYFIK